MIILYLVCAHMHVSMCARAYELQRDNDAFRIMFDLIAKWELILLLFFILRSFNVQVIQYFFYATKSIVLFFPFANHKMSKLTIYNISWIQFGSLLLFYSETVKTSAKVMIEVSSKYWQ